MGQPRTCVYRILKSSWGVRISLTAQADFQAGGAEGKVASGYPVWIAFNASAGRIPASYRQKLADGLSLVASDISRHAAGEPVTVTISDVSYAESDFQLEGLAVVMVRWAESEFGIPRREVVESFERESNRYLIEWKDEG